MIDFDAHICGKCLSEFRGESKDIEMYQDSLGLHFACPSCAKNLKGYVRDSIGTLYEPVMHHPV